MPQTFHSMFVPNESNTMDKRKRIRVGSKLVEMGCVYRVFKIEKRRDNGASQRIIFYEQFFPKPESMMVKCSIPEYSFEEANIRQPIQKKEVRTVLRNLSAKDTNEDGLDDVKAKEDVKLNDIHITTGVAKMYWSAQKASEDDFPKKKRDILDCAICRMEEEIAVVLKISPNTARERITRALQRS